MAEELKLLRLFLSGACRSSAESFSLREKVAASYPLTLTLSLREREYNDKPSCLVEVGALRA